MTQSPVMSANSPEEGYTDSGDIDYEIAGLERRLAEAKAKRSHQLTPRSRTHSHTPPMMQPTPTSPLPRPDSPRHHHPASNHASFHFLLLLSDSALPLGSFAFSSGLESYLAHQKLVARRPSSFASFLPLSLSSYASTTLPFVLAAHRDPPSLPALDDAQDATMVCTVGRRASVAQGRALLAIWERSFATADGGSGSGGAGGAGLGGVDADADAERFVEALRGFSALLKTSSAVNGTRTTSDGSGDGGGGVDAEPPPVAAHLAPLFGVICRLVGLSLEQTAYVFLLGHVKALVSAAVRAGMFGPYQAQKLLAGSVVQGLIAAMVEREWRTRVEDAGQNVPVMDLWVGRHELLYSRIFNS
ncbi:hypothetical protein MFIFM68171_04608 [Madurella fahalii]|uniref:Urease accessory protein UreF n=1 Tax=Madurella fahalii TaxID=1157608 RepID=A0ABQ0G9F4_9PEZI